MKRNILYLLSMVCMVLFSTSCLDEDTSTVAPKKLFPLTSFAVEVDGSYYQGKIDQDKHQVVIGGIEKTSQITNVDFKLMSATATIEPQPSSFLGKWNKENQVTVTTEDGTKTNYTIVFSNYKYEDPYEIFFDDFDVDGNPDPTKWVLCRKQGSDWNDEMSESYDQAFVKDGVLKLQAIKDGDTYKAGGIETNGKFAFTFGKVEVRARITKYPNGAFPAIWLMPSKFIYPGWPNCGEIDIMEHIKQESYIHHTLHTKYTHASPLNTATRFHKCNFQDWVVYGMEWDAEEIRFYVDGVQTYAYQNKHLADEAEAQQWPFTAESQFYLILNMGLGGDRQGSWAGKIDDANLPAEMEVDWVKVSKFPDEEAE